MVNSSKKDVETSKSEEKSTEHSALSAPMIMFMTALDTTWRIFIPTLGGVFLGIGIDHWLNIAPIATIICLLAGVALTAYLIVKQLRDVRRSQK